MSVRRRRPRRAGTGTSTGISTSISTGIGTRRRLRPTRRGIGCALACGLLLVSGCTRSSQPGTGEATGSASGSAAGSATPQSSASVTTRSPSGPVTLRLEVYGGPQEVASYRRLARAYTAVAPQVTVHVDVDPGATASAQRLDREFRTGRAPDLFLTDASRLPDLVQDREVRPVDQLLEARGVEFGDHYERLGLEAFAADSALQCMPNDVSPYVVFYNQILVQPPAITLPGQPPPTPERSGWTWSEFQHAARQVSRGGVKGVYLPPTLATLTPLVRSAGGDVVDDDQQPSTLTLADQKARQAIEQVLGLARDSSLTPTPEELALEGPVSRFQHGRLAMLVGTRALVPRLRKAKGLVFDVYPLPSLGSSATVADVRGYCISRTSKHVQAAADFLTFASGDRGAAITARSGAIVPANLDVRTSDAFEQVDRMPVSQSVFGRVMRRASTMPTAPDWPRLVHRTQPLVDRLFYAPVLDLGAVLDRIDRISARLLARPTPSPSPSPSAGATATGSPSG